MAKPRYLIKLYLSGHIIKRIAFIEYNSPKLTFILHKQRSCVRRWIFVSFYFVITIYRVFAYTGNHKAINVVTFCFIYEC